ncbi:hypothetical protein FHG87_020556 [Trinorchestia longiramus]|nr:hypothetical protein FHG87_020556 [Trinorchestia longiramus]
MKDLKNCFTTPKFQAITSTNSQHNFSPKCNSCSKAIAVPTTEETTTALSLPTPTAARTSPHQHHQEHHHNITTNTTSITTNTTNTTSITTNTTNTTSITTNTTTTTTNPTTISSKNPTNTTLPPPPAVSANGIGASVCTASTARPSLASPTCSRTLNLRAVTGCPTCSYWVSYVQLLAVLRAGHMSDTHNFKITNFFQTTNRAPQLRRVSALATRTAVTTCTHHNARICGACVSSDCTAGVRTIQRSHSGCAHHPEALVEIQMISNGFKKKVIIGCLNKRISNGLMNKRISNGLKNKRISNGLKNKRISNGLKNKRISNGINNKRIRRKK